MSIIPFRIWLLSLGLGMLVGGLFALVDLPVPAPPSFAGVLAIAGLYFGFEIVEVVA